MCQQPKVPCSGFGCFFYQGMINEMTKMSVKLKRLRSAAHERLQNIEHCDPAVQAELEARKDDSESPASHAGQRSMCFPGCCICYYCTTSSVTAGSLLTERCFRYSCVS